MKNTTLLNLIPLSIIISGCAPSEENASESFANDLLKDAGVVILEPGQEISDEFAGEIIGYLLPVDEMNKVVSPSTRKGNDKPILFDYGKRGKSLSYQRALDLSSNMPNNFNLMIDREQSIRLRHKINIGTDKYSWETVRKDTNWPEDNPFKRIYLLIESRNEHSRMSGHVYYKGSMVTIDISGPVTNTTIKNLEEVTWGVAKRLESIYDSKIKHISEGPLFENDPIFTMPDLPDPDVN